MIFEFISRGPLIEEDEKKFWMNLESEISLILDGDDDYCEKNCSKMLCFVFCCFRNIILLQ